MFSDCWGYEIEFSTQKKTVETVFFNFHQSHKVLMFLRPIRFCHTIFTRKGKRDLKLSAIFHNLETYLKCVGSKYYATI